jgi:hypothetical protein
LPATLGVELGKVLLKADSLLGTVLAKGAPPRMFFEPIEGLGRFVDGVLAD